MKYLITALWVFVAFTVTPVQAQNEWRSFKAAEQTSAKSLAKNKSTLYLSTNDELTLFSTNEDRTGHRHYRYQQTHKDILVEGAIYLMHEKNNHVHHANGQLIRDLNISTNPTISEPVALQAALAHMGAARYAWQDATHEQSIKAIKKRSDATFYPVGELVIIDPEFGQEAAHYRLAYKFDIYAVQPFTRQIVYVDATNGSVLKTLEKIHNCTDTPASGDTNYSGSKTFTVCDDTLKSNIQGTEMQVFSADTTYGNPQTPFISVQDSFKDPTAVEVHWATIKTHEYFLNTHNRNSLDGNGIALHSWVHFGENHNNAFWNGTWMTYGDGDGIKFSSFTAPDIVAHEITHGVIEFTADLFYRDESGALNESFSDVFGELAERHMHGTNDWRVGTDIILSPDKTCLRNISNPGDPFAGIQQPDTYGGEHWHTGSGDYGGVHINSGVQNYWFYLLAEGGSGINDNGDAYSVESIGIDKAAAIAYHTLNDYLTPTSEYADARVASIQAAENLPGISSDDVEQVKAAWCAVGVIGEEECEYIQENDPFDVCDRERDSLAMVVIYHALNGPNWEKNTWDLAEPMDTWEGVALNTNGEGCIRTIHLAFDTLVTGNIPLGIDSLANLTRLYLQGCKLTGEIPVGICNLKNLIDLRLYDNELTGNIPPEIGQLTELDRLLLNNNQLSGDIPAGIWTLNKLVALNLHANGNLTGTIPEAIGHLTNLTNLWLFGNQLSGELPNALWTLPNIEKIYLYDNDFTGNIPPEVGNLTSLKELQLGGNQLTDTLPSTLGNLQNLYYLYLEGNNLSGCYTQNLTNLCSQLNTLSYISGGGNSFDASFEDFCFNGAGTCSCRYRDSIALVELYNSISGISWDLNQSMENWSGVTLNEDGCVVEIELDNGGLTGSIPPEIGNLNNLTHLDLSSNGLEGNIPPELSILDNLLSLELDNNQLSGSIPSELGSLTKLTNLNLSSNQLSGDIPGEFGNLISLIDLDLGNNQLIGSFPYQFENLSDLERLSLNLNGLTGHLPPQIGNLSSLMFLDLSENQFNGRIPREVGNLSSLIELSAYNNQFSGQIYNQVTNASNLEILRLYGNQISDDIPSTIGNLTNLRVLQLNDNHIFGGIPSELGSLANLTHVQLGNNRLTGSIPPELGGLGNLILLEINNNRLSGCYTSLSPLCGQLIDSGFDGNADISDGNNFNFEWEDFCNTGIDCNLYSTCRQSDSLALVEIYNANNTSTLTWDLNQLMNTWEGVTLNGDGCVSELILRPKNLTTLPASVGSLTNLTVLDLSENVLTSIPPEVGLLTNLNILKFGKNSLTSLPVELANLTRLSELHLFNNNFTTFPTQIGNLTNLDWLNLTGNSLTTLPPEIGNLTNLTRLDLAENALTSLPPEIGALTKLDNLYLSYNQLTTLPPAIGNLTKLYYLDVSHNLPLESLPGEIGNLITLNTLYIDVSSLTTLPDEIGNLINLDGIEVEVSNLTSIPASIGNLVNLTRLELSFGNLITLPDEVWGLPKLEKLDLANNNFPTLPPQVGDLPSLNELAFNGNGATGCFYENMLDLCGQDIFVDTDNDFDTTWVAFCTDTVGMCDDLVLPGDFNADGRAFIDDMLPWGVAWGNTGVMRPDTTTDWAPKSCPNWDSSVGDFNAVDGKHQDGDGNGIVDHADIDVLLKNYGENYNYTPPPTLQETFTTAQIDLQLVSSEVNGNIVTNTYDLRLLGTSNTHGVACIIKFDDDMPVEQVYMDSLFLSPEEYVSFDTFDTSDKRFDFAMTRTDNNNSLTEGTIATMIVVTDDTQVVDPYESLISGTMMSADGNLTSIGSVEFRICASACPAYMSATGTMTADTIRLEASNMIELKEGFSTGMDTDFSAEIKDCCN